MDKIRIIIIEDHNVLRETLVISLNMEEEFEILGHWGCAEDALEFLRQHTVDMAIVDYILPGIDGAAFAVKAREIQRDIKVLMLSMYTNDESVLKAFESGAVGFVPKHATIAELVSAVKSVRPGEPLLSQRLTAQFINYCSKLKRSEPLLSDMHREILKMAAEGWSNKEISRETGIPVPQVKYLFQSIFKILASRDRTHSVVRAIKRGILNLETLDREDRAISRGLNPGK
jgi:two-component system, NarL family, response regulator